MNIIAWVIFGIITGTIFNILDPRPNLQAVIGSIVLGIIGSVVGGVVAGVIFGVGIESFDFQTLMVAVLGSMLVLLLQRLILKQEI